MRVIGLATVVFAATFVMTVPADAISGGTIDGKLHPAVACIIGQGADGGWTGCASGQLIAPTVVLTAGHVTDFFATEAVHTFVSFEPVVDPATSRLLPVARMVTHPQWDPKNYTNSPDYGVVILAKPLKGVMPLQLPPAGLLDQLKVAQSLQALTAVGYGCGTDFSGIIMCDSAGITRRYAQETVAAVDTETIEMLLNNPGPNGPTGVCFGDSGGPLLLPGTNVTVALQSSARAGCWSTGRAFWLDTPIARSFLANFMQLT